MPSKFWTEQEKLIQKCIEETGLRYISQARFGTYDVDFYLPEIEMVVEADGKYGHFKKRDINRDIDLNKQPGVKYILHIKYDTKEKIKEILWQGLNKLNELDP